MKVFITKYALTKGVMEVDNVELSSSSSNMIHYKVSGYSMHFHKPYWYENKEEALKHAEKLKQRKIDSLKKQILKLEKTVF